MSSACTKPVHIKPITGFLDNRSTPDQVPVGGWRRALNVEVASKDNLCRAEGWERLLSNDLYNNEDLHDQLAESRQSINFLWQSVTNEGLSKLFAGTQNRLYSLNNSIGNWKIIWDGIGGDAIEGCPDRSWYAAQLNNTVIFTNGIDALGYHDIDQPVNIGSTQSVAVIPDAAKISMTKASVVIEWNNLMFYMNLELDGVRQSDVILWSDFKRPLSLVPRPSSSLAGKKSLGTNHAILNAEKLGNFLMIYTTKGIWEVAVSGGEEVLSFRQVYAADDKTGHNRCIAYPNTLVSTGDDHYYWGKDGVYLYNVYLAKPDRVEWIHRATATIFNDLDVTKCKVHVGAHHADKKSIWWSWAGRGEECPTRTFIVNTEYQFSSYLDAGFTALANYSPDNPKTLRQFILERCICTTEELDAAGLFTKEGGFCRPQTAPDCPTAPASFYTQTPLVDGDVTTEDWTQATADADSLCAMLQGVTPQDLCDDELTSDQCDAPLLFIMVAALDNTIKQQTKVYFREKTIGFVGCGDHVKNGYKSILTSGPVDLKFPQEDKVIEAFEIEPYPVDQTVPSMIALRVGTSSRAHDPMAAGQRCPILWQDQDPLDLACISPSTEDEHITDGTRPDEDFSWPLYITGRFFYYELTITNSKVSPVDTGGAVCISRISFYPKLEPRC